METYAISRRYRLSRNTSPDAAIVHARCSPTDEDPAVNSPLIRALPCYVSVDSTLVAYRIRRLPPGHLRLSANGRVHRVRPLDLYVEPFLSRAMFIELIFRLITANCAYRNPRDNNRQFSSAPRRGSATKTQIVQTIPPCPSYAAGLPWLCRSGTGKATALNIARSGGTTPNVGPRDDRIPAVRQQSSRRKSSCDERRRNRKALDGQHSRCRRH
ncbi:hypothetical protein SAMN04487926_11642 [Paraburkholderia steynii]|uniref:Uncharacterized protein n=1 Tax=Paraburkholderia steynii TaxID=1245441 RepID=A0A7Z7BA56_9BURK|nr:hypothetical protein SAMN04487926_11642 [Paraburkholderia steynii]